MGGILTDAQGRSTVDGLWACGEVASTGAHGANRLASNSLLEAVVFGARVARDIAASLPTGRTGQSRARMLTRGHERQPDDRPSRCFAAPWRRMSAWSATGLARQRAPAISALVREASGDRRLANMLSTAKLIAAAALRAKKAAARISAATTLRLTMGWPSAAS